MYNSKEFNTANITLNLSIFLYFYFMNLIVIYLFSIDEVSIFSIFALIVTIAAIQYIYKSCKKTNMIYFIIFIFFIVNLFFFRRFFAFVCTSINIFYSAYILFLLADYGIKHKKFIDNYKNMIIFDKYKPKFFTTLIIFLLSFTVLLIIYFAFLVNKVQVLDLYLILHNKFLFNFIIEINDYIEKLDEFIYMYLVFFAAVIFAVVYFFYKLFILNYQYVFILLPLSKHSSTIPLSSVFPVFNENKIDERNIDKNALQQWFDNSVSCYIKNVYLDIENKTINFKTNNLLDDYQLILLEDNDDNTDKIYSLDEALKIINELMGLVVYKGTNLTNALYTMKEYLEKINALHTNKLSFDKYIDRINRKYIPYVVYLVKTYLRNIDLNDKSLDEIQEKIVYTLDEISYVIQKIYQSKIDFVKFNLDVELDTIDLLIKQKGYYKDIL